LEPPVRSIPSWLAGVLQELELTRPRLVTVDDIQRVLPQRRSVVRNANRRADQTGLAAGDRPSGPPRIHPAEAAGPYRPGDPGSSCVANWKRHPGAFPRWLTRPHGAGYAQGPPAAHRGRAIRCVDSTPDACTLRGPSHGSAPASDTRDGLPVPNPPNFSLRSRSSRHVLTRRC